MVSTTNEEVLNQVNPVEVQLQQQQQAEQQAVVGPITDEDFEKAQKLFQQGKKNLFLNKYDESVNNFGDACKVYAAKFGEMDPKCAEVYFFYGRSLLELARVENTVLGNALSGVPEETEPVNDSRYGNPDDVAAEEKSEISDKVIDALCSTEEQATATTAATTTEVVAEVATEAAAAAAAPVVAATESTATEAAAATVEGAAEEEEEEEGDDEEVEGEETAEAKEEEADDDIGNLQSSWEMFELAKLIYSKNFEEDALFKSKRVAECLLKLGEISIEQEIYDQAVTDITESIRVQEEVAAGERDERMLAESYYQLGMARQFNNQFVEANDAYQRSINIVQLKIEKLRGRLLGVTAEGADADLERTAINDEIAELEALLPEMTSKLEEVNEQGQQTLSLIKEAKECFTSNAAAVAAAATATPVVVTGDVRDITSMVKSKRKNESGADEDGLTKKTRLSGEVEESAVAVTAVAPIEVDENKENTVVVVEPVVRMEESKEPVAAELAVTEEPAAAVVTTAEPVATA
jgi:nuclear autoantigenic sperm protein